jgi:hypothetical protein
MTAALLAVAIAGWVVPAATAQAPTGFEDAAGDGGPFDVVHVGLTVRNGTVAVEVRLAPGGAVPDGAMLRGVAAFGEPGAVEPAEWYQFTVTGNATQAFAAHGTPRDVAIVSSSWHATGVRLEFERADAAPASCSFAVVESGVLGDGGFERLDVAPTGFASMDSAWPVQACPEGMPAAVAVTPEAKGAAGAGALGLAVALGGAMVLRRRLS